MELCGLCPSFHIHVSLSGLHISRSPHIFPSRIGRPIMGIYKSLTDTWMWKLELRPRNSFSVNSCLEFSVLCLCSVMVIPIICSPVLCPEWVGQGISPYGTGWTAVQTAAWTKFSNHFVFRYTIFYRFTCYSCFKGIATKKMYTPL